MASQLTDSLSATNDTYALFGEPKYGTVSLTLFDGTTPTAYFYIGPERKQPGNLSWAIFVSSVDRLSSTPPQHGPILQHHGITNAHRHLYCKAKAASSFMLAARSLVLQGTYQHHHRPEQHCVTQDLACHWGLQLILARYFGNSAHCEHRQTTW